MADSQQHEEMPKIEVFGGIEHRFANNFDIAQPRTMVYIDFIQQDPRDPKRGEHVGQIVIHPALAKVLGEQLSNLRVPEAD